MTDNSFTANGNPISIRSATTDDIEQLYAFVKSGRHDTEKDYFETALNEQADGKRLIFLAMSGDKILGYTHLNFHPLYASFNRLQIPEIQDLFVHPDARNQGVGKYLVLACESAARSKAISDIGIGVGITNRFGAAQRLYTKLGYRPDGAGVVFDRQAVSSGEIKPVDDRLCLMLLKSLQT